MRAALPSGGGREAEGSNAHPQQPLPAWEALALLPTDHSIRTLTHPHILTHMQIAKSIMAGERLPVPEPERLPGPDALPPAQLEALLSVMRRCWLQAPEARPGFQQVAAELRCADRAGWGYGPVGGLLLRAVSDIQLTRIAHAALASPHRRCRDILRALEAAGFSRSRRRLNV